jgi:peptide/nickel transport system substrate-binding protein
MLAEMVAAGDIPVLQDRIPSEPLVVDVFDEVGQYGGTLNIVTYSQTGGGDTIVVRRFEPLLVLSSDGADIVPNVVRHWEEAPDAKSLTLYLREGMHWSDGDPFTAEDITFQFNDCFTNDELYPVKPAKWSPGGELATAVKVDDYTVRLEFAHPYPTATAVLAHSGGFQGSVYNPKHYMKQFHPDYADTGKLTAMVKEEGLDNWYQLFGQRASIWNGANPVPTLSSYRLSEATSTYIKFQRNPYYWKVDPEGNQLPYIDEVFCRVVNGMEIATGMIGAGDVDFAAFNSTDIQNLPYYKEQEDSGNFNTLVWKSVYGADAGFEINRTVADPVLREVFSDVRFHRAMSLALDRSEINEKIYFGLGAEVQATVHPSCSWYEQRFAEAYAEYDPDRANELLDELGLEWDENREFRLRSDGERFTILLEFVQTETPKTAICEIAKEQWKRVGVDVLIKEVSWNLEREHIRSDQSQMNLWHISPVLDATWYSHEPFWCVIVEAETRWGAGWGRWVMSGGERGVEPPQVVKQIQADFEAMKIAVDEDERIRLGKRILAAQAENLWTIGTIGRAPIPVIASKRLGNVPDEALWGWDMLFGSFSSLPEQFYFKE